MSANIAKHPLVLKDFPENLRFVFILKLQKRTGLTNNEIFLYFPPILLENIILFDKFVLLKKTNH